MGKELIEEYLESRSKYLADRTKIEYERDLIIFNEWLNRKNKDLLTATKNDISEYIDKVQVGKRATRRKFSAIRMFYVYLWENEKIQVNPAERIYKNIKIPKRNPYFLTDEKLETLFKYCENDILYSTIVKTFYFTGIRLDELVTLKLTDISFKEHQMTVIGKGDKQRTIPFSAVLSDQLQAYLEAREAIESNSLFIYNGKGISRGKVENIFSSIKEHIGFHVRPHLLRHTFATNAMAKGMTLAEVQELLGHEHAATTSIYVHLSKQTKESYEKAFN